MTLVVVIGLMALVFLAIGLGPTVWRSVRHRGLQKSGVAAPARIVDVIDTGNRFNDNPQVRIKVEVQPATGDPFHGEITTVVSVVALPRLEPGTMLNVKYDAEDPSRIVLAKDE